MIIGETEYLDAVYVQLAQAFDVWINYFNTAEMQPSTPKAETQGLTEQFNGSWLGKLNQRDLMIDTTKVVGAADCLPWLCDGNPHLNHQHIEKTTDASLQRLRTEYIDLYQLYWSERQMISSLD